MRSALPCLKTSDLMGISIRSWLSQQSSAHSGWLCQYGVADVSMHQGIAYFLALHGKV